MKLFIRTILVVVTLFIFINLSKESEDNLLSVELEIKNHHFSPKELHLEKEKKYKLHVTNQDDTIEEFESNDLRIEKIIPAKTKASFFIGPLKDGEYVFFGEFHEETAQGIIKVK